MGKPVPGIKNTWFYKFNFYLITDVAWFRGPTLLEDNADNVEIWRHRDRHFLRLYDVQNSSFYSCTALNTLGEVTHHFRLGLRKGKKNWHNLDLIVNSNFSIIIWRNIAFQSTDAKSAFAVSVVMPPVATARNPKINSLCFFHLASICNSQLTGQKGLQSHYAI